MVQDTAKDESAHLDMISNPLKGNMGKEKYFSLCLEMAEFWDNIDNYKQYCCHTV